MFQEDKISKWMERVRDAEEFARAGISQKQHTCSAFWCLTGISPKLDD